MNHREYYAYEETLANARAQASEAEASGDVSRDPVADCAAAAPDEKDGGSADEQYIHVESSAASMLHATLGPTAPHPDVVVQTASLAAVHPPSITVSLSLQDVAAAGTLSTLQLEAVAYAFQRFEGERLPGGARPGFFLGDGTGVGKGRQIAGVVLEHWRRAGGGGRCLWCSATPDLKWDAERDLADLGVADNIPIWPKGHSFLPTGDLDAQGIGNGILFCSYSLLVSGSSSAKRKAGQKDLESSPSARSSRLQQLLQWLTVHDSDPLLVFDECHKAKNLTSNTGKASRAAVAVSALQERLPGAKVIYCSATGATQMKNLGYMTRLGTWGFSNFEELKESIESSGMGAMEMFSMGLKAVGAYCCRTLSFVGAEFEVGVVELSDEFRLLYDRSAEFWQLLLRLTQRLDDVNPPLERSKASRFWSSHLRFFRQMLMSAKVDELARMALEAVSQHNMCVVIGLQSTGDASLAQARAEMEEEEALQDFVSAPKMVLKNLIHKHIGGERAGVLSAAPLDALLVQLHMCVAAWVSKSDRADTQAAPSPQEEGDGASDDDIVFVQEKSREEVRSDAILRQLRVGENLNQDLKVSLDRVVHVERDLVKHYASGSSAQDASRGRDNSNNNRNDASEGSQTDSLQWLGRRVRASGQEWIVVGWDGSASENDDKSETHTRFYLQQVDQPALVWSLSRSDLEAMAALPHARTPVAMGDGVRLFLSAQGKWAVAPRSHEERGQWIGGRIVGWDPAAERVAAVMENNMQIVFTLQNLQLMRAREASCVSNSHNSGKEVDAEEARRSAAEPKLPLEGRSLKVGPSENAQGARPRVEASLLPDDNHHDHIPSACGPEVIEVESGSDEDVGNEYIGSMENQKHTAKTPMEPRENALSELVRHRIKQIQKLLCHATDALKLPPNPLDSLVERLGGRDKVAEMTGRAGGLVRGPDGGVAYVSRRAGTGTPQRLMNMQEREAFMAGEKLFAIISEAASTGVSLHADRRCKNTRRRLHLTLELPWSAEKAIQQFGRSHRSNQTCAPKYRILVTTCGGERRFASSAAKRLQVLGALLRGDRRALGPGAELKAFDVDNALGHAALTRVFTDLTQVSSPMPGVSPPPITNGASFWSHCRSALGAVGLPLKMGQPAAPEMRGRVDRFLNRILGLAIKDQALLFQYFNSTYDATVASSKSAGTFDDGIVHLRAESVSIVPGYPIQIHKHGPSGAVTQLLQLCVDRGVSHASAVASLDAHLSDAATWNSVAAGRHSSFYVATFGGMRNSSRPLVLMASEIRKSHARAEQRMRIIRPHNGSAAPMWLPDLLRNYRQVSQAEARPLWEAWFRDLEYTNHHNRSVGARKSTVCLVVGAVLPICKHLCQVRDGLVLGGGGDVPTVLSSARPLTKRKLMRVVRANLDNGQKVIGIHVEHRHLELLQQMCTSTVIDAPVLQPPPTHYMFETLHNIITTPAERKKNGREVNSFV